VAISYAFQRWETRLWTGQIYALCKFDLHSSCLFSTSFTFSLHYVKAPRASPVGGIKVLCCETKASNGRRRISARGGRLGSYQRSSFRGLDHLRSCSLCDGPWLRSVGRRYRKHVCYLGDRVAMMAIESRVCPGDRSGGRSGCCRFWGIGVVKHFTLKGVESGEEWADLA
jgi:hypothetical protein